MSIAVRPQNPMENQTLEAFLKLPMSRVVCELSSVDNMQHTGAINKQLKVLPTGGSGFVVETLNQLEVETASNGRVTRFSYMELQPFPKSLEPSILNVFKR